MNQTLWLCLPLLLLQVGDSIWIKMFVHRELSHDAIQFLIVFLIPFFILITWKNQRNCEAEHVKWEPWQKEQPRKNGVQNQPHRAFIDSGWSYGLKGDSTFIYKRISLYDTSPRPLTTNNHRIIFLPTSR